MTPLVSIIIPCYNAARWLPETIASVRAQDWPEVEMIVVNDGSTDNSASVLEQLAGKDLVVLHQPNAGPSAAQNLGLKVARGSFINFLDADDVLFPGKLAAQMHRLQTEDDCVATGAWTRFSSDVNAGTFVPEPIWCDLDPVTFITTSWSGGGMMHGAQWLIPRQILDKAGQWDDRLTLINDLEFFTRLALAAKAILFCADSRTGYRVHAQGSLSQAHSAKAWASARLATTLATEYLLRAERSPRTCKAAADSWQRLIYSAHPHAPELVLFGEKTVRQLGGSDVVPVGTGYFNAVRRVFGWKIARSAQVTWHRLRS